MAEMLIWLTDRTNEESIHKTAKLAQRGDVIVAMPDGWPWGDMELNNPDFAVVQVVDAVPADLDNLLQPEVPLEPLPDGESWASTNNTLQFRGFHIDVDAAVGGGVLAAGARTTTTLAQVEALTVQKPPIEDPAVIGDSGRVFG